MGNLFLSTHPFVTNLRASAPSFSPSFSPPSLPLAVEEHHKKHLKASRFSFRRCSCAEGFQKSFQVDFLRAALPHQCPDRDRLNAEVYLLSYTPTRNRDTREEERCVAATFPQGESSWSDKPE
ncbi:hypothetical protein NQZ68_022194, partial [Dissostichus eleginoides]